MTATAQLTAAATPTEIRTALPAEAPDAATFGYGGDCYPCTIIRRTRTSITLRRDAYTPKPGQEGRKYGDPIEYDYFADPNGAVKTARLGRDGAYRIGGQRGPAVGIGHRRFSWDPSF